jgi:riboflavin kinase/FMN adenylyltransferase
MKLIRDLIRPMPLAAVALGTFDGVHRGHQAILKETVRIARREGWCATAVTFEPQPREYLDRQSAPARLMTLGEKALAMADLGIEQVVALRFDARLVSRSPQAFCDLLAGPIAACWVMTGEDFRFGAGRAGDWATLQRDGRFAVAAMPAVLHAGERVSSTRVRRALALGDLPLAQALLGRPYSIRGHVGHGFRRGRTLGFPTANVALGRVRRARPPLVGVYAVNLLGVAGRPQAIGAASLGVNPAVHAGGVPTLEVHVLDYAGDLYGQCLTVQFMHKLRDEAHYPSLAALTAAIAADCARAREHLMQR